MELTRNEVAKVMDGTAIGVTRYFPAECPLKAGDEITLAYGVDQATSHPTIVAKATVIGVRPFTVRERRDNTTEAREEARKEGWASPAEWWGHFEIRYGTLPDEAIVHRIQLRVEDRVEAAGVPDAGQMPMLGPR